MDILIGLQKPSLPVVGECFEWILPSSPFVKAASYAGEGKLSLSVYVSDPDVPIAPNHLEKALRLTAMEKKIWLFCWTEAGVEYVAKIQSLLVT